MLLQLIEFPINLMSFSTAFAITLLLLGLSFLKFSKLTKQILIGLVGVMLSFIIIMLISSIKFSFSTFIQKFSQEFDNKTEYESSFSNGDTYQKSTLNLNGSLMDIDISDITTRGFNMNFTNYEAFKINYDSLTYSYDVQGESKGLSQNLSYSIGKIQLSDSTNWNIKSNISSSKIKGDFKNIKISSVFLTSTESNIEFVFGTKSPQVDLLIESEKSDLSIKVPYNAYCELTSNIPMNDFSIEDFKQIYSGFYTLGDSTNSTAKIKITLTGNVSDLIISRNR